MIKDNKNIDLLKKLSKFTKPEPGSDEVIAYNIIDTILNRMLNRHLS